MKGHKNHEARMHNKGVEKRASGGKVESEEQTNAKKGEKDKIADEYKGKNRADRVVKVEKNTGGSVVARKRGGAVPGATTAKRLDKRSRGGSAKSPLSGADAPNASYAQSKPRINEGGKGKTIG